MANQMERQMQKQIIGICMSFFWLQNLSSSYQGDFGTCPFGMKARYKQTRKVKWVFKYPDLEAGVKG